MSQWSPASERKLSGVPKALHDMDILLSVLLKGRSQAKPWQRMLAVLLADVDRLMQVLRMTVAMERSDDEILAAVQDLKAAARRAHTALAGTRADVPTKVSTRLLNDLANRLSSELATNRRDMVA